MARCESLSLGSWVLMWMCCVDGVDCTAEDAVHWQPASRCHRKRTWSSCRRYLKRSHRLCHRALQVNSCADVEPRPHVERKAVHEAVSTAAVLHGAHCPLLECTFETVIVDVEAHCHSRSQGYVYLVSQYSQAVNDKITADQTAMYLAEQRSVRACVGFYPPCIRMCVLLILAASLLSGFCVLCCDEGHSSCAML